MEDSINDFLISKGANQKTPWWNQRLKKQPTKRVETSRFFQSHEMRVATFIQVLQKTIQKSMDTHSSHHGNQTGKIEFPKHFVLSCCKDTNLAPVAIQALFWRKTRTPLLNFQAFLVTKGRMCWSTNKKPSESVWRPLVPTQLCGEPCVHQIHSS